MPEIKQKVDVFMVEYLCDSCEKGVLRFTGKKMPGITKDTINHIHRCTNCKAGKSVPNKIYPFQMYEAVEGNIISDGKETA